MSYTLFYRSLDILQHSRIHRMSTMCEALFYVLDILENKTDKIPARIEASLLWGEKSEVCSMLYCDKGDLKGRGLKGGGCTEILGWMARGSLSADMWGDGFRSEEERVQRPLGARVAEGLRKHRDRGGGAEWRRRNLPLSFSTVFPPCCTTPCT